MGDWQCYLQTWGQEIVAQGGRPHSCATRLDKWIQWAWMVSTKKSKWLRCSHFYFVIPGERYKYIMSHRKFTKEQVIHLYSRFVFKITTVSLSLLRRLTSVLAEVLCIGFSTSTLSKDCQIQGQHYDTTGEATTCNAGISCECLFMFWLLHSQSSSWLMTWEK